MEEEKGFYIVNPKGAIHVVDEQHARWRLKLPGWRLATEDEIKAYIEAGGNQRWDKPLAKPFSADPTSQIIPAAAQRKRAPKE